MPRKIPFFYSFNAKKFQKKFTFTHLLSITIIFIVLNQLFAKNNFNKQKLLFLHKNNIINLLKKVMKQTFFFFI